MSHNFILIDALTHFDSFQSFVKPVFKFGELIVDLHLSFVKSVLNV